MCRPDDFPPYINPARVHVSNDEFMVTGICDHEMCLDCGHHVDPDHDRRGDNDCSTCDDMAPPGPCARATATT